MPILAQIGRGSIGLSVLGGQWSAHSTPQNDYDYITVAGPVETSTDSFLWGQGGGQRYVGGWIVPAHHLEPGDAAKKRVTIEFLDCPMDELALFGNVLRRRQKNAERGYLLHLCFSLLQPTSRSRTGGLT